MIGHISATNRETALEHVIDKEKDGLKPVLFHFIRWDSPKCFFVVDQQSPFPYEQEVLLHDGVRLFVLSMEE